MRSFKNMFIDTFVASEIIKISMQNYEALHVSTECQSQCKLQTVAELQDVLYA